jgi:hypothetical protein
MSFHSVLGAFFLLEVVVVGGAGVAVGTELDVELGDALGRHSICIYNRLTQSVKTTAEYLLSMRLSLLTTQIIQQIAAVPTESG